MECKPIQEATYERNIMRQQKSTHGGKQPSLKDRVDEAGDAHQQKGRSN